MIVEQNVPATLKVVDRAIILKSGRVVFEGPAHELEAKRTCGNGFDGHPPADARRACGRRCSSLRLGSHDLRTPCSASAAPRSLVLADNLAAIVAAETEPEVAPPGQARPNGRRPAAATVFSRTAVRVDRYAAAAANGLANGGRAGRGLSARAWHAGAYILPALLAEAEATAPTADVIAGLARLEMPGVSRRLSPPRHDGHPHAAFATLGAAAGWPAPGLCRGPSQRRCLGREHVLAGPYNHALDGALVRNLWTATGAWTGFAPPTGPLARRIPETTYDVFVGCFGTKPCRPAHGGLGECWAIAAAITSCLPAASMRIPRSRPACACVPRSPPSRTSRHRRDHGRDPSGPTLTDTRTRDRALRQIFDAARVATPVVRGSGGQALSRAALSDPRSRRCAAACAWCRTWTSSHGPRIGPPASRWRSPTAALGGEIDSARGGPTSRSPS